MRIISSKQRDDIARFFQDIQSQVQEAFLRDGMCDASDKSGPVGT